MKIYARIVGILLIGITFGVSASDDKSANKEKTKKIEYPEKYETRTINADEIERLLKHHGEKLLVVNFWATWCPPCVAELPHFVEVHEEYKDKGVQFVGLSSDFLSKYKETVPPFLKKKEIPYPNFVIDADANTLIPKISQKWSGALPATFIYDTEGNKLFEALKPLEKKELESAIEESLKKVEHKSKQD